MKILLVIYIAFNFWMWTEYIDEIKSTMFDKLLGLVILLPFGLPLFILFRDFEG